MYLDTASYGLPPRASAAALRAVLDQWQHGSTSWKPWEQYAEDSRALFAQLMGVRTENVSLGSTVSNFAGLVAASLPSGSRVVAPDIDFTSNLFPWMVHDDRGIEVRCVPLGDLVSSIDDRTALVALSVVQSATGQIADLAAITRRARECGAAIFLDATQACGWLPMKGIDFDYLVCHSYKWLMAARGATFFVVDPKAQKALVPIHANWAAGEDRHASYYGPPLRLATSARRLDSSPIWFSWVSAKASLEIVHEIGVQTIHDHDVGLANRFRARMGMPAGDSAIVSVNIPGAAAALSRAGISAGLRAGAARLSFHIYNTPADADAAADALRPERRESPAEGNGLHSSEP